LRRFVAGVATTYTWAGTSPKLLFNGVLQTNDGLRDVVCYYLRGRTVQLRIQRENFATEHWLANPELPGGPYQLSRLTHADQGTGDSRACMVLAAETLAGVRLLLRSALYPLWVEEQLAAALAPLDDGAAESYMVVLPAEADTGPTAALTVLDDGACTAVILVTSASDAGASAALTVVDDGACTTVIVVSDGYADADTTAALTVVDDGACTTVIVLGGSYSDSASATLNPLDDGYCTTE